MTRPLLLTGFLLLSGMAQSQEAENVRSGSESFDAGNRCDGGQSIGGSTRGDWYLVWENDAVAAFSGSDEFYTQGIRLGYDFAQNQAPRFIERQASWLCRFSAKLDIGGTSSDRTWTSGVYLGQHMFTPGDISVAELIPDDRPYAAWLYVGERFGIRNIIEKDRKTNYHAFDFQVGLVGPKAQGEWVQREFHELIGDSDVPMGWDNQLPDEPEVFASYRFTRRNMLTRPSSGWLEADAMLTYEVGLGTLQGYVEPGVTLRIGHALGDPPFANLGPREPLAALADEGETSRCLDGPGIFRIEECFMFARVTGRATGWNVFLDGTWSRDSHSVDRDPFYYDWSVGFRLRWRAFELDYEFVRRSREFSPVPASGENRDGHHDYGSVNAHCRENVGWVCPTFFGILLGLVAAQ